MATFYCSECRKTITTGVSGCVRFPNKSPNVPDSISDLFNGVFK